MDQPRPHDYGPSPFPGLVDEDGLPPGLLLLRTTGDPSVVLIRILVGWVFAWEGLQKFLLPGERGSGAFEAWGFPLPDLMGPLVGAFEIGCGLLVLAGVGVRVAVVPLLAIILVALMRVKLPLLFSEGLLAGISAMHLDLAMLLGCLFLLWKGAGPMSVDYRMSVTPEGAPSLDE